MPWWFDLPNWKTLKQSEAREVLRFLQGLCTAGPRPRDLFPIASYTGAEHKREGFSCNVKYSTMKQE